MPEILTLPDPDYPLVERSKEGDTRAFDQLILKYGEKLFGLAYHMTSHTEEADDLLHQIFAKVYRSLRQFRKQTAFDVWIYQIAIQTILHSLKNRRKRSGLNLCHLDDAIQKDLELDRFIGGIFPTSNLDLKELQKMVNVGFQQLSESHRILITLMDVQGLSPAKTAMILRISENSIHLKLKKAHLQLQSHLADSMK